MPEFDVATLAARLRQPGFVACQPARARDAAAGRVMEVGRLDRAGKRGALCGAGGAVLLNRRCRATRRGRQGRDQAAQGIAEKTSPARSASVSTASGHWPLSSNSARKMPGSRPEDSGGVSSIAAALDEDIAAGAFGEFAAFIAENHFVGLQARHFAS